MICRPAVRRDVVRRTLIWIQWIVCGAVLGYGAWLRFRLPQVPLFDYDVLGYLSPAVDKLLGHGFPHVLRNYFYPGFLYAVLRLFGDFRAISVVQHLLGLLAGAILFLSWRRLPKFLNPPASAGPVYGFAGVLLCAIYLTAEEPIRFEMSVRPEGLVSFLVITNIYLALLYCENVFARDPRRTSSAIGIAVVVTCTATILAKPSLLLGVAPSIVPVAATLWCPVSKKDKLVLIIGSAVGALVLALPAQLAARSDPANRTFLPTQLFVIHARIIREQIRSDLDTSRDTKYSKGLLGEVEHILTDELTAASLDKTYPTLGFHPDYLMFGPRSLDAQLRTRFDDDLDRLSAFYWYYYARTWFHRPGAMAAKVCREMRVFYDIPCSAYWLWRTRDLSRDYRDSIAAVEKFSMPQIWSRYTPFTDFLEQTVRLARGESHIVVPVTVQRLQVFAARTYLVSLVLGIAAIVIVALRPRLRRELGLFAAIVGVLTWWNFGCCLEVAVVHTLDNVRYDTIQIIFTVLTQFGAVFLMSELARRAIRKKNSCEADDGLRPADGKTNFRRA